MHDKKLNTYNTLQYVSPQMLTVAYILTLEISLRPLKCQRKSTVVANMAAADVTINTGHVKCFRPQ